MSNLTLNKQPGYYYDEVSLSWQLGSNVSYINYTVNGAQPAISEYIAYDTLTPATPFIAVTQDGRGNVVYDGGFPKLYNRYAPVGVNSFSGLDAAMKYFHNAIHWVANSQKVQGGNRKFLVLGDARTEEAYPIKDPVKNGGFRATLDELFRIAGFVPTYKDPSDYAVGLLNPTLSELEEYVGVFMVSSVSTMTPLITDSAVVDLSTFRENGNGIIVVTDHGPDYTSLNQARNEPGGFFATANKIITNFGAYFTGTYDRVPVNVGFLRSQYGDHPLYNGMDNSENIYAGGSESKVVVQQFTKYTTANLQPFTLTAGQKVIQAIAVLNDGSVETYRFVYMVATGQLVAFLDGQGVEISHADVGFNNILPLNIQILGVGLGSISGQVLRNGQKVANISYTESTGTVQDILNPLTGNKIIVGDGDVIRVEITSPFQYSNQMTVTRTQPDMSGKVTLPEINQALRTQFNTTKNGEALRLTANHIVQLLPELNLKVRPDPASNVRMIKAYLNDELV